MINQPDSDQLTKDELVDQIQESEQEHAGPNETLRSHIEMFSRYSPVFRKVGYTIAGALIVPLVIGFLMYQLSPVFNSTGNSTVNTEAYDLSTLRGSIFHGLLTLIAPLFVCLILARALKPNALAERYFNWSATLCAGLLRTVEMLIWVCLPLRFFYTCLETFNDGQWNNSLGRILFVAAMGALTYGFLITSRLLQRWIAESNRSTVWYDGLRNILLSCLPFVPPCLAVLSAIGYHFTAVEMSLNVIWTSLMVVGVAMVAGFVSRLLLIAQFGIKLRQLQRTESGEIENEASIDINAITGQVNRLLRATALVVIAMIAWQFWSSVIPSVDYLKDFQLWVSAIGVVVITFVLSRNLPGLLEITLLDRLPLDRGGRYAIGFVMRYVVGLVGLFVACQMVGFSWNSVQWLAGALMVGLGFGLQEIFANIVSGIIILIERPVRVGDVVTVNNTTGTVMKMALRATTIKDRDFRELIVPNKKFITEDVMNWTLTDRKSRLVFKVGVAYGSDTELVHNTLIKVANRHPLVNAEPKPEVVLDSFGDSTINFELRTVIPSRDIFAKVQHELNMAIEKEFQLKGIEIAFPQQEIHIKNLKDLPVGGPDRGSGPFRGAGAERAAGSGSTESGSGGSVSAFHESIVVDQNSVPMVLDSGVDEKIAATGNPNKSVEEVPVEDETVHELVTDLIAEYGPPPPPLKIFAKSDSASFEQEVEKIAAHSKMSPESPNDDESLVKLNRVEIDPSLLDIVAQGSANIELPLSENEPDMVQKDVAESGGDAQVVASQEEEEVQELGEEEPVLIFKMAEPESNPLFELVLNSDQPETEFELVTEYIAEADAETEHKQTVVNKSEAEESVEQVSAFRGLAVKQKSKAKQESNALPTVAEQDVVATKADGNEEPRRVFRFPLKQVRGNNVVVVRDHRAA